MNEKINDLKQKSQTQPPMTKLDLSSFDFNEMSQHEINDLFTVLREFTALFALELGAFTLDGMATEKIRNIFVELKSLQYLRKLSVSPVDNNVLDTPNDSAIEAFAQGLAQCLQLQALDLSNSVVGLEAVGLLLKNIQSLHNLTTLDLGHNPLSFMPAESITEAFSPLTSLAGLHTLDLSYIGDFSRCRDDFLEALSTVIGSLPGLTDLRLRGNKVGAMSTKQCEILFSHAPFLSRVCRLDLSNNDFFRQKEGARVKLVSQLQGASKLLSLGLSGILLYDMSDEAITSLLGGIARIPSLEVLDLSHNAFMYMSPEKISTLFSCLQNIPGLVEINLAHCFDDSATIEQINAFAHGLESLTRLEKLNLNQCEFTDMTSRHKDVLINVFKSHPSLLFVDGFDHAKVQGRLRNHRQSALMRSALICLVLSQNSVPIDLVDRFFQERVAPKQHGAYAKHLFASVNKLRARDSKLEPQTNNVKLAM